MGGLASRQGNRQAVGAEAGEQASGWGSRRVFRGEAGVWLLWAGKRTGRTASRRVVRGEGEQSGEMPQRGLGGGLVGERAGWWAGEQLGQKPVHGFTRLAGEQASGQGRR